MKNFLATIFNSTILMAIGLSLFVALAGCQTGRTTERAQPLTEKSVTSQYPGEHTFGNEPQLRPQGEGGWENPNQ